MTDKKPIRNRSKKDEYKRPKFTYTEKLSKDEIEDLLEDYVEIKDMNKIPVNTHVRYFVTKNNKRLFRTGGLLINNSGLPDYVVLSNGKQSWSVQTKGTIFFKKMTIKEIKEDYEKEIEEIENENEDLKRMVKKLQSELNILKKNL